MANQAEPQANKRKENIKVLHPDKRRCWQMG